MKPPLGIFDLRSMKPCMTMKQAAEYLGLRPVSVRRLVSQGKLKRRGPPGRRPVLLYREDVQAYGMRRGKAMPNPPPWVDESLEADISLSRVDGSPGKKPVRTLDNFTWEHVPLIQKDMRKKHGDVAFVISVRAFDGSGWTVQYVPEKKGPRKLWRKYQGREFWLVG